MGWVAPQATALLAALGAAAAVAVLIAGAVALRSLLARLAAHRRPAPTTEGEGVGITTTGLVAEEAAEPLE